MIILQSNECDSVYRGTTLFWAWQGQAAPSLVEDHVQKGSHSTSYLSWCLHPIPKGMDAKIEGCSKLSCCHASHPFVVIFGQTRSWSREGGWNWRSALSERRVLAPVSKIPGPPKFKRGTKLKLQLSLKWLSSVTVRCSLNWLPFLPPLASTKLIQNGTRYKFTLLDQLTALLVKPAVKTAQKSKSRVEWAF